LIPINQKPPWVVAAIGFIVGIIFNSAFYITEFGYEPGNEKEILGFVLIGGVMGCVLFYSLTIFARNKK